MIEINLPFDTLINHKIICQESESDSRSTSERQGGGFSSEIHAVDSPRAGTDKQTFFKPRPNNTPPAENVFIGQDISFDWKVKDMCTYANQKSTNLRMKLNGISFHDTEDEGY
jgi:hypothetical protein